MRSRNACLQSLVPGPCPQMLEKGLQGLERVVSSLRDASTEDISSKRLRIWAPALRSGLQVRLFPMRRKDYPYANTGHTICFDCRPIGRLEE